MRTDEGIGHEYENTWTNGIVPLCEQLTGDFKDRLVSPLYPASFGAYIKEIFQLPKDWNENDFYLFNLPKLCLMYDAMKDDPQIDEKVFVRYLLTYCPESNRPYICRDTNKHLIEEKNTHALIYRLNNCFLPPAKTTDENE